LTNPISHYDFLQSGDPNCEFSLIEIYEQLVIKHLIQRKTEKLTLSNRSGIQAACFNLLGGPDGATFHTQDRAAGAGEDMSLPWLKHFLSTAPTGLDTEVHSSSETVPLLLGPAASAEILRLMVPWFGADNAQTGRSPLSGTVGRKEFSDKISIVDDGNLAGGIHSSPFDMEGCLTQRTVLVERGAVRDFLHDSYTATRENRISTGNSVRLPNGSMPAINSTSILFTPGENVSQGEDLSSAVERGILIDRIVSAERPYGGSSTEFSLRGSGWRIAQGKKKHRIVAVEWRIDLRELLSRAVMVGDDLELFSGVGGVSILCEDIKLGIGE
jgi:predicted Zn-dependent protease